MVCQFETAEDGTSILVNTRRVLGWVEQQLCVEWEARQDEAKREKDAKECPTEMQKLLAPIRESYNRRIGRTARAAYLAKVLAYITY